MRAEFQLSVKLFSETRQLLFQVFDVFAQGRHFGFQEAYAIFFIRTTKHLRWGRRRSGNVFHIARKQVHVAGFFGPRLAG